jgi:uncharacterized lipoprotein YajG
VNSNRLIFVLCTAAALGACRNEPLEKSTTPSASAALTNAEIKQAPVVVKEDFEEQAKQSITATNLDDKLNELEKQIGK